MFSLFRRGQGSAPAAPAPSQAARAPAPKSPESGMTKVSMTVNGKAATAEVFDVELIPKRLITPNPDRLGYIRFAFEQGWTVDQVHEITAIDPWFLKHIRDMVDLEKELAKETLAGISREKLLAAKRDGVELN